jgi:two-component system NtrC family sensor kinase
MKQTDSRGRLELQTDHTDKLGRISISDNGPGIEPENLKKIFDPFYTTKEVGKGTGLGLSICYGIISEHEGRIWAESLPGNGTTFYIELPLPGRAIQS